MIENDIYRNIYTPSLNGKSIIKRNKKDSGMGTVIIYGFVLIIIFLFMIS